MKNKFNKHLKLKPTIKMVMIRRNGRMVKIKSIKDEISIVIKKRLRLLTKLNNQREYEVFVVACP